MDKKEYLSRLSEIESPLTRISGWLSILQNEYINRFNSGQRELFDKMLANSEALNGKLSRLRLLRSETEQMHAFSHELSAQAASIRGFSRHILSELEQQGEHQHYLEKVESAANYVYQLCRDALLTVHLRQNQRREKCSISTVELGWEQNRS